MIEIQQLRKAYGSILAVDDLSFGIASGETFGLLGPNGAGKTTTINMMVGVLKPDSGEVIINGVTDPTDPSVRIQIGNAPQSLALYDDLTARENLAFFARLYGLAGSHLKERVAWVLDVVGLSDRANDQVKTFSGGMKRRLNLSVALIHDAPVLLLDEPTVGVDPQSRNLIFDTIERLKSEGRTIVYTTHYMEEAQRLCDRVAIVDHGKLLAMGTVDELISHHGGHSTIEVEFASRPKLPTNLEGHLEDKLFKMVTAKPLEVLNKLIEGGARFTQVKIERPDLETVFLNLTGRSLRD
ncbi:MAG: ABC transporter ATP-binding protein [Candidatus Zixiibacteriota bacterium]|nr:MAG: ABC transporter ATP-binding protein [candidate division Zixibacteria bacterium]